jgi:hypothetical protein
MIRSNSSTPSGLIKSTRSPEEIEYGVCCTRVNENGPEVVLTNEEYLLHEASSLEY